MVFYMPKDYSSIIAIIDTVNKQGGNKELKKELIDAQKDCQGIDLSFKELKGWHIGNINFNRSTFNYTDFRCTKLEAAQFEKANFTNAFAISFKELCTSFANEVLIDKCDRYQKIGRASCRERV